MLLVAERRRRIEARQTRRFLLLLRDLDIAVDRSPDDQAIFELARSHGLTFYDAAYLELAVRQGAIASLDEALLRTCAAEGVETL